MSSTSASKQQQQQHGCTTTSRQHRSASFDLKQSSSTNCSDEAHQLIETVLFLQRKGRRSFWSLENDDDNESIATGATMMSNSPRLALQQALWQRCRELDQNRPVVGSHHEQQSLQRKLLLLEQPANHHCNMLESGYTPLHWAVYAADLRQVLFLLRTASGRSRLAQRPMEMLHTIQHCPPHPSHGPSSKSTKSSSSSSGQEELLRVLTSARDQEGWTAAQLLASRQRGELAACRASLSAHCAREMRRRNSRLWHTGSSSTSAAAARIVLEGPEDEQNEFDVLSRVWLGEQQQHRQRQQSQNDSSEDDEADEEEEEEEDRIGDDQSTENRTSKIQYGCEVFTFGRAHHCALGVVASSQAKDLPLGSSSANNSNNKATSMRPQRVQAFAQDTVGRSGAAVALATATYHTLTVTANGHLYACGLGKAGRLGTGDEKPCATPVRVMGALQRQFVVAVAAAENHSLCVTATGHVYAFGSNRFGQLGFSNNASSSSSAAAGEATSSSRCLPRRVDDLKQTFCVSVAAGERHSVALSRGGEVHVWGDNSAGQLGFSNRTSNNNSLHKVQKVEALWTSASGPKKAIAIAASEKSTLVLTVNGSGKRSLPGNSVYYWGHGNHVPSRVQFEDKNKTRPINPIAISCARYHNVAIMSAGQVFTWGLHADSLARKRSSSNADKMSSSSLSAPQLVTGMLPENGGGKAVAVSASEKHTAVVTDDGSLFTWGDVYENHVLGHEGVRWQPDPKRVPGVHRAVAVSAAKEHTALLIGASFPSLPTNEITAPSIPSLEYFAARKIAEHVDLFNVIPILVTAERTQTPCLLEYCRDFIRRNIDGVLNVGQRGYMDCFLNEQLVSIAADKKYRDGPDHPLAAQVVFAGSADCPLFGEDTLCSTDKWFQACQQLIQQPSVSSIVNRCSLESRGINEDYNDWQVDRRARLRSTSFSDTSVVATSLEKYPSRMGATCSQHCFELTNEMNVSSIALAEAKLACLTKESRSIRKRLSQISRLESGKSAPGFVLSNEERFKISRRPQLETDLSVFERTIVSVEMRLKHLRIEQEVKLEVAAESGACPQTVKDEEKRPESALADDNTNKQLARTLRCEVCKVSCPDRRSLELHLNGRKHRNRSAHVDESRTNEASASIFEEQQRQLIRDTFSRDTPVVEPAASSPWGQGSKSAGSMQPRYKLPPPPHPVHELVPNPVMSTPPKPKSLHMIMAEESSRQANKASFQLPPGSAPTMKSPPWESSKARVAVSLTSSNSASAATCSIRHSLGDFIVGSNKPTPKGLSSSPSKPFGWASPSATPSAPATHSPPATLCAGALLAPSSEVLPAAASASDSTTDMSTAANAVVSFREIQQEELSFKEKQDPTYAEGGKWFIERRERAGSFHQIQDEAAKQTEEERFIEEQIAIEKQIYQEIAAAQRMKAKPVASKKRTGKERNGSSSKPKGGENAIDKGEKQTNIDVVGDSSSKPKRRPRKRQQANLPRSPEKTEVRTLSFTQEIDS